jgi:hypothetical protein
MTTDSSSSASVATCGATLLVANVANEVEAVQRTLTDRFGPAVVVEQGFGAGT